MERRIICFSGIDGSGKSEHARLVLRELTAEGVNCRYMWLRYPRFLSLFPEALYGLISRKEKGESSSNRKTHETLFQSRSLVHSNKAVTDLWLFFQLIDSLLVMLKKVYLPALFGCTLILDRCAIDTLVDLAVSLRKENLISDAIGKSFVKLIPSHSLVLIFDASVDVVALRRKKEDDVCEFENLEKKRVLYLSLSRMYRWNVVSTNKALPEVHDQIMKLVRP